MHVLYYRINRKSNLILFEDLAMEKTKSSLKTELDNTTDKSSVNKMDNIFNIIISKYKSKDKETENSYEKFYNFFLFYLRKYE